MSFANNLFIFPPPSTFLVPTTTVSSIYMSKTSTDCLTTNKPTFNQGLRLKAGLFFSLVSVFRGIFPPTRLWAALWSA